MFKKIVSNLPFSPALVGQLGTYSKKIRKERKIRQLGLTFIVLSLVVQSLTLFQPTEPASASNDQSGSAHQLQDTSLGNKVIKSLTATNTSQGFVDASSVTAFASDQISYTITVKNIGTATTIKLEENLSDLLDYSTLTDNGGGTLNKTTDVLSWPDISLNPNSQQTRTFVIKVLDTIPMTARGTINTRSYDCTMTNAFGNSINISVDCPAVKTIENIVTKFPKASLLDIIVLSLTVFSVTIYFYARSRQLEKEVRLIRKDISTGTI